MRPYRSSDKPACLEVFQSNVPRFFAPHEQAEFAAFRDSLPAPGLDRHDMRLALTPERCAALERLYQQQAWADAPA